MPNREQLIEQLDVLKRLARFIEGKVARGADFGESPDVRPDFIDEVLDEAADLLERDAAVLEGLEAALRGLVDVCEEHLPQIYGKTYTASEGGYFIERELRIAKEALDG